MFALVAQKKQAGKWVMLYYFQTLLKSEEYP